MRKILGVVPETPDEIDLLLQPLQKAGWVAQRTGMSVSAINAAICENRLSLPAPVALTETAPDQAAARGRRWLPAQIEAHLRGDPIPFASTVPLQAPASPPSPPAPRNVFAAICAANAELSRQYQL